MTTHNVDKMPSPTRRLQWISSIDEENEPALNALVSQMAAFYGRNTQYYADIDYASEAWQTDPVYKDIAARLLRASRILELGCGAARILDHYPQLAPRYTGVDFSRELLAANRKRHPEATFAPLDHGGRPPVDLGVFDAVFSVFVIEHCVRPRQFLADSIRLLAPGGVWMLRCPHFLGIGRIPSQRVGFSAGTGREKLLRGKLADAFVTGWDTRVRIPAECSRL
jgi:SAM-dependent methyltransferase